MRTLEIRWLPRITFRCLNELAHSRSLIYIDLRYCNQLRIRHIQRFQLMNQQIAVEFDQLEESSGSEEEPMEDDAEPVGKNCNGNNRKRYQREYSISRDHSQSGSANHNNQFDVTALLQEALGGV